MPESSPSRQRASWEFLALPLLFAGMMLVLQCRPIHDVDIFWQVKAGEIALARGTLPDKEEFSATHAGEPFVPAAWLAQVVFASVFRLGGWPVLHLFDSLVWASGFLIVAVAARRGSGSLGAAVIATALGFTVALPFASVRPQTFAVLAFAVLIAIMRSEWSVARKLMLAAPLLVLWQNLHPSATVAAAASAGAALFGWARLARCRSGPKPWAETWLAVLASAASLVTPAGFKLFEVAAYNAEISRELGVSEWLPLWSEANRSASSTAWFGLGMTVVLVVRRGSQVRAQDLGRAAVLGALMLTAYRFAPFWVLAMVPIWADALATKSPVAPPETGKTSALRCALAWVICLLVAALGPQFLRPRLFAEYLPLEGVSRLQAAGVSGVIYCHPAWGGPLIFAGYPHSKVSYDGRYYVYSRQEWQNYSQVVAGEVPLADLVQTYRPVGFFLRPNAEAALIEQLRASSAWTEIHADDVCCVFVARGGE